MGVGAILGGASILGSVIGGRSASKAADAQADAAEQANDTQRYIFDQQVALTEPQRVVGQNALAALAYEAGVGALPTFGSTPANALSGGGSGMTIEEIPGQGGNLTFQRIGGGDDEFAAMLNGMRVGTGNSNRDRERFRAMYGGQGGGGFRVGDRTFATRQEAEAYLNSTQSASQSGDMQYTPIAFPDQPDTSLAAFEASPGYDFRLNEGMKAIERAAAARGLRLSGGALKDSARFGQGLASDEYGAFYGRTMNDYSRQYGEAMDDQNLLRSLAGMGQTATQQQIGAGNQFAAGTSANLNRMGNALAGGYTGQANAITGGINNLANIYGMGMSGYLGPNPGLGITPLANPFGGAA